MLHFNENNYDFTSVLKSLGEMEAPQKQIYLLYLGKHHFPESYTTL